MARINHGHAAFHLEHRNPKPSPLGLMTAQLPSLSRRDNTCGKDDKAVQCAKPADSNNITIPVVLAVVIPVVAAILLFFYLHRRHVRRQRKEDANDPHKSLDFGMSMSNANTGGSKKGKSAGADTNIDVGTEKTSRHGRYVSMDMGQASPYLLPPGLHGSRESFHSLSRNVNNADDRYRPTTQIAADPTHSYSKSHGVGDDSSSFSSGRGYGNDNMNQNLLGSAQGMPRSIPPSLRSSPVDKPVIPEIRIPEAERQLARKSLPTVEAGPSLPPPAQLDPRDSYMGKDSAELRKSNNYLGPLIHSREPSADLLSQSTDPVTSASPAASPSPAMQKTSNRKSPPPMISTTPELSRPPRLQSLKPPTEPIHQGKFLDDSTDHGDSFKLTPPSPGKQPKPPQSSIAPNPRHETIPSVYDHTLGEVNPPLRAYDRRVSMGVRPLPPDDPTDNPEQRANRIRSFYKEYFDDSKPGPPQAPAGAYVEDYDQSYLGDGGQYVVAQPEFAVPYTRRAMTPPPRAPPRFQGTARHQQTSSGGRSMTPSSRPFSPASSHFGPSGRGSPRPTLPPPAPLRALPTPHLLKEDAFALPIDFAPPTSYRDRAAGRPESPLGGMRPYSPMLPAHLPLASSFDDLSVMPSPHLLRKSGTFTALDFAPPPRFKTSDTASDTGSIRSNRSAMSAQQLHSIRAGAYRVSRIPREVVGTRHQFNDTLKPQWGMRP